MWEKKRIEEKENQVLDNENCTVKKEEYYTF